MEFLKSTLNLLPNPHNFNPSTSVPSLTNRVIVVTGGNAGIGLQTVLQLSLHSPANLYLAARSKSKFDNAMTEILRANPSAKDCVHFLQLDLTSLDSVKAAARTILDENERLDILINNAGIMAAPPGQTREGYEIHFGTNYLSHCLLTQLLVPLMQRTASRKDVEKKGSVRVVNVSSMAYAMAASFKGPDGSGIDVSEGTIRSDGKGVHGYDLYSITKLAQVWWTKEAARRWGGDLDSPVDNDGSGSILSVSVHPGRIKSSKILNGFMEREGWDTYKVVQKVFDCLVPNITTAQGAWTQLWAATAPMERRESGDGNKKATGVVNGAYYMPVGIKHETKRYQDDIASKQLWDWTADELKKYGVDSKL